MKRKMKVEINDTETVIEYEGETEEEIAQKIQRDENALLQYMLTGNDEGSKSFCFQGFMFKKDLIATARFTEPDF